MKTQNMNWKLLATSFNEGLNNALQQQHHAAQFIALAGRQLIPQRTDDSNTNMQYQAGKEWLVGNELPNGGRIALQLSELKLCILDEENACKNEIHLVGKTKQQVFELLKKILAGQDLDVSKFINKLHYEIPAHELDGVDAVFSIPEKKYFQENTSYRHNAEIALNEIAGMFEKADPVRIWPHHFDTGSFVPVAYNADGAVSKSIGLGWAIPDGMINEPYFYLSFWSESPLEDFNNLPDPETGEWIKTGWKGGVARHSDILKCSTSGLQLEFVESFFRSGIKILTRNFNL